MTTPLGVIGGTGTIGHPLVRRLLHHARPFRCIVRDAARARRVLPDGVEFREADLRDPDSIAAAIEGCEAVYTNLAQPFSQRAWDPDLEGTRTLIRAAKRAGVRRIMRISALGCPEYRDGWWVIRNKATAEDELMASGLGWTIFRPTWLMESLGLFVLGPLILKPGGPDTPLHWIAGTDYADQVIRAVDLPASVNKSYVMQGPEAVSMRDAIRRFRKALGGGRIVASVPAPVLAVMARLSSRPKYLRDLLRFTWATNGGIQACQSWDELGRPETTIEAYAASIRLTGDLPQK